LTIKSAFAHTAPNAGSPRAASLFNGQSFAVTARTADDAWLRIDFAGARTEAWIAASIGTVSGDLSKVMIAPGAEPVVDTPVSTNPSGTPEAPAATEAPADFFQPDGPVIPVVSQTARDIYQRGLAMGNNPRAFSKVGDCQSVVPYFLAAFDYGPNLYNLGPYTDLQPAIDNFANSWARDSIASNRGFNVATVFVPVWADPKRCLRNETPLACEFRLNRPSIVIITMETWWTGSPAGYESYLRRIIEFSIAHGTVPILGTKADNVEGNGAINGVIVKLAQEYDVPLWNFWAAVQPLPNHGLHRDGFHLTWERNYFNDPAVMQQAWPWRNLTALQAIDAVWRGVSAP
ncbi:MAG: SGNH/GDSL hydrolase family protein, partial [Anaerolineales bacterium]